MLIEYKPLVSVPVAETISESAYVLVNDNGEIKKILVSNLQGGESNAD